MTVAAAPTSVPPPLARRAASGSRLGFAAVLVVAALAYGWGLARDPIEPYYAASVRAMATSWHAFVFGAFDPGATITMDKLPGSFWIQALFVRVLSAWGVGPAPWVMVLPQVLEGVGTVALIYVAVRTLVGPRAGLLAAAVLAVTPAAIALHRGNVADPLMLLMLTAAVAATTRAIRPGLATVPVAPLVIAGVAVGLAFQAKMIEAWLVLPALALVVVLAAEGRLRRRVAVTLSGGLVALVVSLAWILAVDLLPASGRPAVDGSARNSLLEQTFIYNGFGRIGQSPLQILAGQGLALTSPGLAPGGPAGWDRLLAGALGRDVGWLLPLALVVLVAGLWSRRRHPRTDPLRATYVLVGAWLLVTGIAVSLGAVVNVYYAASIAPATAALVAVGVAQLWRHRDRRTAWVVAAGAMTLTVAYGAVLALHSRTDPVEMGAATVAAIVAILVGVTALVLASVTARRAPLADASPDGSSDARVVDGESGSGADVVAGSDANVIDGGSGADVVAGSDARVVDGGASRVARSAVLLGLAAVLVLPVTASASVVALGRGSFDTPFETVREAAAVQRLFVVTPRYVARTLPAIERARAGAPDLLAVQSSAVASVFAYPTGAEVLPIGGFTGTQPTPTVDQIREGVVRGRFHLVLAFPGPDPRIAWIAAHCPSPHHTAPPFVDFYCNPADAR